jgi:predicted RNase H-like HicB family nuclease
VGLATVLEPSEKGGFTAPVPSLPGCITEGDTREEALQNIREAIEPYLEPVMTISPERVETTFILSEGSRGRPIDRRRRLVLDQEQRGSPPVPASVQVWPGNDSGTPE